MLHSAKELQGLTIQGKDGEIGKVDDLYFSDDAWTVRHVVVSPSNANRRVLVSPVVVSHKDKEWDRIDVSLTREQVMNSPDIDTISPVAHSPDQEHKDLNAPTLDVDGGQVVNAQMPRRNGGTQPAMPPPIDTAPDEQVPLGKVQSGAANSGQHSAREFIGFRIQARDGEIGHIDDLLIDDQTWRINYLIIDTSNLWFGKKVILPPNWVRQLKWEEQQAVVDLKRDTIKNSPKFDAETIKNQS